MSKTLGSILMVAAAIGVNIIPGVGQLASAAILVGSGILSQAFRQLPPPETAETCIKPPRPGSR